jgi:hypothetical protein
VDVVVSALSDRIAAAIDAPKPTSIVLAELIDEARTELTCVTEERDRARSKSLDPTTPAALVPGARGDVFEAEFAAERLTVAIERLKDRHEAAVVRERETARAAAALAAERDALAAELTEAYPRLVGELVDLLGRVRALDERLAPLGLDGVENVARGIPRNGRIAGEPVSLLASSVRLPAFDANERVYSWPPAATGPIGVPAVSLEAVRFVERAKLAAWERKAS